jgi:hypothetical protein
MRKTKWKKLLAGDGVEIVALTMLAWVVFFVLYICLQAVVSPGRS